MIEPDIVRDVAGIDPIFREAIKRAIKDDEWPLYFSGPTGIGKTCAGLCLCDHFARQPEAKERPVLYYRLPNLVADIDSASKGRLVHPQTGARRSQQVLWNVWRNALCVVLDEIGVDESIEMAGIHHYEQVEQGVLLQALDERLASKRPTLLISNHTPSQLDSVERYSERVISRLSASVVVDGENLADRRVRKATA